LAEPIGELQYLPLSLPPIRAGLGRSHAASLAAAFALHGSLLTALLVASDERPIGVGGSELNAINIEVVSSAAVLESRSTVAEPARTAALAAPVAPTDGSPEAPLASSGAGGRPKPDAVQSGQGESDPAEAAEDSRSPPRDAPSKSPAPEATSASSAPGAAAARGADTIELRSPALAAAGAGETGEYGRAVIATLARVRPTLSTGLRGTVRIGFTISADGDVASAHVARSSGKSMLDSAALTLIKSLRFPKPPPELTTADLAFVVPCIFN
jgi:TonB family protein